MDTVLLVKLQSGEEVVGRIKKEDDTSYTLSNARLLMVQPDQSGQMSIGMIPWIVGAPDSDVVMQKSQISGRIVNVPKAFEDGYLQQTSGIQFAAAGSGKIV